MAGATVKMSVDVTSFKKGIKEATAEVKTLDAQLKTNEAQLKLNGDKELYMANKAALLKSKLEAQRTVVVNTKKALDDLATKGVEPTSKQYRDMETALANAQTKMVETQTEIKNLKDEEKNAKGEAKGMNTQLKNIGKGVSFENLTSGLKNVTETLEKGARLAVNFAKKVARSAMDSTEWADDVLTRATKWGVDAETVQKMDVVADKIDTDAETIIMARKKLAKKDGDLDDVLGIDTTGMSLDEKFWAAGEAIMNMTDEVEREQAAQEIFGRNWADLLPLFTAGQEAYNEAMEQTSVLTNDQVKKLGEADDAFKQVEHEMELLKNQFWADNAQTIIDLMQWMLDNKDAVVAALSAIAAGFGLLKVGELASNVMKLVNGFKGLTGLGGGGGGTTGVGGSPVTDGGAGGGGILSTVASKGKGLLKAGASAVAKEVATLGGASALVPAAVFTAGVAPAMLLQNSVTEQIRQEQATMEQNAAALAEAHSENAKFVLTTAQNSYLAKDENGNEKKALFGLGGSYSQLTDATFESMMGLKDRSGAEMAKLQFSLMGVVNPMTGNYAWNDLQTLWSGKLEAGAAQELAISIAKAMSNTSIGQMWEWQSRSSTGTVRELPSGWEYDQFGRPRRTYETNEAYDYLDTNEFGMMDDRQYMAWLAQENARYSALHGGESSADSEQTTTITRTMENLPKNLADSLKNVSIVMDKEKVGYIIAGIVSQRIASEVQ